MAQTFPEWPEETNLTFVDVPEQPDPGALTRWTLYADTLKPDLLPHKLCPPSLMSFCRA